MNILIQGIGGIGGIVAGKLLLAGYNPILVTHNEKITKKINNSGICYYESHKEHAVPARAYTFVEDIPKNLQFDFNFLIMKADAVHESIEKTKAITKGYFVTFQNGVVEDPLIDRIKDRLIGVVVVWGATMTAPGEYIKTTSGKMIIGAVEHEANTDAEEKLQDILSKVTPTEISENIIGAKWAKLAISCAINALGAISGITLGKILAEKKNRDALLGTYSEVVEVAKALNIQLEKVTANPYMLYRSKNAGFSTQFFKDMVAKIVGRKYENIKSSTLQSLERGRKSEVEYLNGYLLRKAQQVTIPTPINEALYNMIREIEEGKREILQENLLEIHKLLD